MKRSVLAVLVTLCMLAAMLPQMAPFAGATQPETDMPYAVEGGNLWQSLF